MKINLRKSLSMKLPKLLSGRLTNKIEIKARTANSTYPKVAVQWLNQALYFYQRSCLVDSEVLQNRYLRVAAKRCA